MHSGAAPLRVASIVPCGGCWVCHRYEKLLKLNLKKVQQREIVRVVMHCSGQSATCVVHIAVRMTLLASMLVHRRAIHAKSRAWGKTLIRCDGFDRPARDLCWFVDIAPVQFLAILCFSCCSALLWGKWGSKSRRPPFGPR